MRERGLKKKKEKKTKGAKAETKAKWKWKVVINKLDSYIYSLMLADQSEHVKAARPSQLHSLGYKQKKLLSFLWLHIRDMRYGYIARCRRLFSSIPVTKKEILLFWPLLPLLLWLVLWLAISVWWSFFIVDLSLLFTGSLYYQYMSPKSGDVL